MGVLTNVVGTDESLSQQSTYFWRLLFFKQEE